MPSGKLLALGLLVILTAIYPIVVSLHLLRIFVKPCHLNSFELGMLQSQMYGRQIFFTYFPVCHFEYINSSGWRRLKDSSASGNHSTTGLFCIVYGIN